MAKCVYIFLFPLFLLALAAHAQGYFIYKGGSGGYDISFPQCTRYFPDKPFDFGVVGVNGGKAFTQNYCLYSEFLWAHSALAPVSLYMNLNAPSGESELYGLFGPAGKCLSDDETCQGYNYGFNAAQYAYQYATSQSVYSSMWWFDIETANTWSDTVLINERVLQGAIDFFSSEFIQVGIYSTKRDWFEIMGKSYEPRQNFITPVPNWIGGDPILPVWLYCQQPFARNSQVWLVQFGYGNFDGDYACP